MKNECKCLSCAMIKKNDEKKVEEKLDKIEMEMDFIMKRFMEVK